MIKIVKGSEHQKLMRENIKFGYCRIFNSASLKFSYKVNAAKIANHDFDLLKYVKLKFVIFQL